MTAALAFLDESGDTGHPLYGGSSLFVVGLVVFAERDEAARCDARIDRLRSELGKAGRYEFHFRSNSHAVRLASLRAVSPFKFTHYAAVLEKSSRSYTGGETLYLDASSRAIRQVDPALDRARLTVDAGSRDRRSRREVAMAIRQRVNGDAGYVALAVVRPQDSASQNLVQLADYVTGLVSWAELKKSGAGNYRRLLRKHEGERWRGPA